LRSKRGAVIPVFSSLGVLLAMVVIIISQSSDESFLFEIGADQNPLLDSYTVAEGARRYIERSVEYSENSVECDPKDVASFDMAAFNDSFQNFMQNVPTYSMRLFIENPYEAPVTYRMYLESGVIYGEAERLIVTNCPKLLAEQDQCPTFRINTSVNADIVYPLSCS
jgi:hypothetical protein